MFINYLESTIGKIMHAVFILPAQHAPLNRRHDKFPLYYACGFPLYMALFNIYYYARFIGEIIADSVVFIHGFHVHNKFSTLNVLSIYVKFVG